MGDKNKYILIILFSIPVTLCNNLWANLTEYFICGLGMYSVYYKSSQWICGFCFKKNLFRIITLVWVLTYFFCQVYPKSHCSCLYRWCLTTRVLYFQIHYLYSFLFLNYTNYYCLHYPQSLLLFFFYHLVF